MKFTVITYIEHKKVGHEFYSYGPYTREMNIWFKHVNEVEIVAPLISGNPNSTEIAYSHKWLFFNEIPAINLLSVKSAFLALVHFPEIILKAFRAMRRSDHIHLRCPGNIGLIACILQIFFPKKQKTAKYAGNWDRKAEQPWSYKLQKWILGNTFLTRNMQVLVYGEWEYQTKNIKPFFTASFSEKEKHEVQKKPFSEPFVFIFVGNLVKGKQPLEAIKLVEGINTEGKIGADQEIRANWEARANNVCLEFYGNGPERERLEEYCRKKKIEKFVQFKGSRPLEDLKAAYQKAHFVILPSRSEGWPKAIAEGMFFGCIPIATPVSCVPWMLGGGSRGILLKNQELRAKSQKGKNEWSENARKIRILMADPEEMKRMSEEAKKWSQQYTLEKFEIAIQEVLLNSNENRVTETGKLSPAPFRACPDTSGDGAKRGKERE